MTTEENKAAVRRFVEEIWNKKNLALTGEFMDTNFVLHTAGLPDFKGPEGFKQFVTMNTTAFPDFHVAIDDMIAEGDKVVYRVTVRGTHKGDLMGTAPTGKQVTASAIVIGQFAGDKKVEEWMVNDQLGIMQQIGAVPKQ